MAAAKTSLVENINRRKRTGTSRPKSRSTVSREAYSAMEEGWPQSQGRKAGAKKAPSRKKSSAKKAPSRKKASGKAPSRKKTAGKKAPAHKKAAARHS